jgi:hypothetical protein
MAKRLTGLVVSCLVLALTGAASAPGLEDDPACQALRTAGEMKLRVSSDGQAPPEAYLPVLQRYREIVERYPESPCARTALDSIAVLYASGLSRPEEAIAAWEQVIERYPGEAEAKNALCSLRDTSEVALRSPDRWQAELRRTTDVLKRALSSQTNERGRCGVLGTLVWAADLAGDTRQAVAYCQQVLATPEDDPWDWRRNATEYIERAKAWPLVGLFETAGVTYTTPADSLTPDIEVEQRLFRSLSVSAGAPRGQEFKSLLTFVSAAPPQETKPKGLIQALPDGRTTVTWERGLKGGGLLSYSEADRPRVVWKSKAHFGGVKVWREAQMVRPGRQLVTVIVEAEWPVSVEIMGSNDAPIDANSVNPRRETPPATTVTRRQIQWQFEHSSVVPESGTMGNLDAGRGQVFTFEMDLPPGVKCVMPRVTVRWSHMDWAVGPDAPPSQAPAATRYNGAVGDLPYILESPTPFRVTSRWVFSQVTCHLWERTERK